MHLSAYDKVRTLLEGYLTAHRHRHLKMVEIGSMVAEATQFDIKPLLAGAEWEYTGVDIAAGRNVDVVLADPHNWREIPAQSVDILLANQVFEHVEYTWNAMFDIARVLKPRGVAVIVSPSSGPEHRFPLDCWRIYPDGWRALCNYSGVNAVEVYTQWQPLFYCDGSEKWKDSCLFLQKPEMNEAEWSLFNRRLALQKALLSPTAALDESPAPAQAAPSALPVFENRRVLETFATARRKSHIYPLRYKKRTAKQHLKAFVKELLPVRA